MKNLNVSFVFLALFAACTTPKATEDRAPSAVSSLEGNVSGAYAGPGQVQTSQAAVTTWNQFCQGQQSAADIPRVNYSNPQVMQAARTLSKVADMSFYFYAGPRNNYRLRSGGGPASGAGIPAGISNNAHNFLVILCGEFRDRPSMIAEKIRWVLNTYKLPATAQGPIDLTKNIWSQVSANSYYPYLNLSSKLFDFKRADQPRYVNVASYQVDNPVAGQTVCETKFIFSEYVAKNRDLTDYNAYKQEFAAFSADRNKCSADDLDYYYDFRGDSNFKPNSPESNGMIWYSSSITNNCASVTTAKPNVRITNAECANYFKSPFMSRWNSARAGLAAWMFRAQQYDQTFSQAGTPVTIIPSRDGGSRPYSFRIGTNVENTFLNGWNSIQYWAYGDMGFNRVIALNTSSPNFALGYERVRDALNRHTNWYASGFDDGMGMAKDQAYSPFVASSYVMTSSDEFTAPGVTVQSPTDGRKHWMFVFKVKKSNWYTPVSLNNKTPINFDTQWFDETSWGTDGLADTERAWDRLGTALEGEYDSIIYLHNIKTDRTVSNDGLPPINGN